MKNLLITLSILLLSTTVSAQKAEKSNCVVTPTEVSFTSIFSTNFGEKIETSHKYLYQLSCARVSIDVEWKCAGFYADVNNVLDKNYLKQIALDPRTIEVQAVVGNIAIIRIRNNKQLVIDTNENTRHFIFVENYESLNLYGRTEGVCK